ncbi:MAG: hypothetical protein FJ096_02750 [Deltaproteobacteria bacterium]|nr:hypothetical protein [Deltaproteobacteria bacterium]
MEIFLDKRAVKAIRLSAADAIEEGDTEALKEDILEAFPEEQIEGLEQMLGGGDFAELIDEILDEWSGDDVDELFDLLETQLSDHGVDLKYQAGGKAAVDDEDEDEVEDDEDEDDEEDEDEEDDLEYDGDLDEGGDDAG